MIFALVEWDEHHHDRVLFDDHTDGGQRLVVVAQHDTGRESVRPITAREEP